MISLSLCLLWEQYKRIGGHYSDIFTPTTWDSSMSHTTSPKQREWLLFGSFTQENTKRRYSTRCSHERSSFNEILGALLRAASRPHKENHGDAEGKKSYCCDNTKTKERRLDTNDFNPAVMTPKQTNEGSTLTTSTTRAREGVLRKYSCKIAAGAGAGSG